MMFLYKRQPLCTQKIKNTKVIFKSTGKPNTWRKHTPPPYEFFKRKTHIFFHKPTLT